MESKAKNDLKKVVIYYEVEGEEGTKKMTCNIVGELDLDFIMFALRKWSNKSGANISVSRQMKNSIRLNRFDYGKRRAKII